MANETKKRLFLEALDQYISFHTPYLKTIRAKFDDVKTKDDLDKLLQEVSILPSWHIYQDLLRYLNEESIVENQKPKKGKLGNISKHSIEVGIKLDDVGDNTGEESDSSEQNIYVDE